jgi:beta-N-acetylhexosaminidase
MTLTERIGKTLVFGIPGSRVTLRDVRLFRDTGAAGLILYRINYRSPDQVRRLVTELEEALGRRLLVTVDHEGGRVVMFGGGVTVFPDNLALGTAGRTDWAARQGAIEARELRRFGVDVNFAPTVDVLTDAFSPNIGIRSYGADSARVGALASARIRAMQKGGVSACAKHFPGLGPATLDPHLDLPVIDMTWREWRRTHRPPFAHAIAAGVDVVMTSHPLYPRMDPTPRTPATFSRRLVHDLLRTDMGFTGVISSDDLEMGALGRVGTVGPAAVRAVQAGHDLLLCCHREELQRQVFDHLRRAYEDGTLAERDLDRSIERIDALAARRRRRFLHGEPLPASSGKSLADRIARAGLSVGSTPSSPPLPLQPTADVRILFPDFRPLARRIMIEPELLRPRRLFGLSSRRRLRRLPMNPAAKEISDAVHFAASGDVTVFFCFDAHMNPGERRLLDRLQRAPRPLIFVPLRDPYDRSWARSSTTVVTAFGFRHCQIAACLHAIFGLAPGLLLGKENVVPKALAGVSLGATEGPDED